MRIKKTSETRALAGNVVNTYNNSQTSAYSSQYSNKAFGGTILWTNNSPTSSFASQNITLDSSDYDMYEVIYKPYNNQSIALNTGKIPKGMGTTLLFNAGNSTNGPYVYRRDITYTDATTLAAGTATEAYASTNAANNNMCIPQYVIGYKTGLF